MKSMVVHSPTNSSKQIRLTLLLNGTVANKTPIKRRLTDEFGLKVCKPAKTWAYPFLES